MEKAPTSSNPPPSKDPKDSKALLRLIHFNDVYDIQPTGKNGEGGAYYFKALLDKKRTDNTLTLFSGDAFSPSILTSLFHGWQMVQCLQHFKIDAACFGNHEFDFEIEHTESLARGCCFPWLLGNLIDRRTQEPLGGGG
jgi:5'-nucleotidase